MNMANATLGRILSEETRSCIEIAGAADGADDDDDADDTAAAAAAATACCD